MSTGAVQAAGGRGDAALAAGVLGILVVLVVPLPPALLDVFLAANISLSLLVLVTTLRAREPLEFSTFPSILLVTTLCRLALNVASSRLILLDGDAGAVIEGFGRFVVGGDVLVGGVMFLILVVVQFVVITKGASRVSEVAARFTLDALPGKQMAIDADLNAGHIGEEEARRRRAEVTREAEFHGAMDGASKFVRGDAIAGLIITAINIVGGVIAGLADGLGVQAALQKYAVLTVGDGLVSQIPALLISTAAGVLTVKTSSRAALAADLAAELLERPGVLGTVAGMLVLFALAPGLPGVPFLVLAAVAAALHLASRGRPAARPGPAEPAAAARAQDPLELAAEALHVDRIALELGFALVPLGDPARGGTLVERIALLRRQVAADWGWIVPAVRLREELALAGDAYRIVVAGHVVASGQLDPARYLAIGGEGVEGDLDGIPGVDPTFGLPATWIREEDRAQAELRGWAVVDPTTALITHLGEVLRGHAHEVLTRDDVQALLDNLKRTAPAVVNETVPGLLGLGEVQRALAALLRERVSIRPLQAILEALADQVPRGKEPGQLVEAARQRVARSVAAPHVDQDGVLRVLTLDPRLERRLIEGFGRPEAGGLDGPFLHALVDAVSAEVRRASARAAGRPDPVVVVQGQVRPRVAELLRATLPRLAVLSYGELEGARRVEPAGVVKTGEAA